MYKYKRGFTFLELIISLSIVTALCCFSIPALVEFYQKHLIRNLAFNLALSFKKASIIAVTEGKNIMVLPIDKNWQSGWVAFEDNNHNSLLDKNEHIFDKFVNINKLKLSASKLNLDCIIFNNVGLTYSCEYGVSKISGLLSNGTISFQPDNNRQCKYTFNVVMSRNRAKVCEASVLDKNVCICK